MKKVFTRYRNILGIASLLTAFLPLVVLESVKVFSAGPGDDQIANSVGDVDVVRRIPMQVNDIVYNAQDGKLYASRPSSSSTFGNCITRIDPITATALASTFVGSEPGRLVLSDNGQSLFMSLDGAYAIRRFEMPTMTAGLQFAIGNDTSGNVYSASDFAVTPGNPDLVAVARYTSNTSSTSGVAAYDRGRRLAGMTSGGLSVNYLAFTNAPNPLYGSSQYSGLRTMSINDLGVGDLGTSTTFGLARIKSAGALIISGDGKVVDPASRTLLGTFSTNTTQAFAIDMDSGRAYFATRDYATNSVTIKAFDIHTYVMIGSLTIPNMPSDPIALTRYSTNGLAMVTTDKQLFMIQTSLIPTNNPLPVPSITPAATPTPTPTPFASFTRTIPLPNNDFIYDAATQKFLVTVPSSDPVRGNSITQVDPKTGAFGQSLFFGSEPGRIGVSDDKQTAWISVYGAGAIRKFDISTLTPGPQYSLGSDYNGPINAYDIEVMPGSPNTFALSSSYSYGTVGVYDSGVRRTKTASSSSSSYLNFRTPTALLAGTGPIAWYNVAADGLTTGGTLLGSTGSGKPVIDNGRLYTTDGRVIDIDTQTVAGTFAGVRGGAVAVDSANNRAYFFDNTSGNTIKAFDIYTFLPVGSISIDYFSNTPRRLVRWGTNGLAFQEDGAKLGVIQTALVDPGTAVPVATPTPTPTVTPSPTPIATFVRQVSVPANDLVYSASKQALYASVPGSAGLGLGNTIAKVIPETGQLASATFIGSEPGQMALSTDGLTVYSKLAGAANAVRRMDLATDTAGLQFVPATNFQDMKVMPGSPQTIAVAGPSGSGVTIYDNNVARPNSTSGGAYGISTIDFADPNTIYGYDGYSSGYELVKFLVSPSGVSGTNVGNNMITGYGAQIKYANGKMFSSTGRVFDVASQSLAGSFTSVSGAMAIDPDLGRAFFLYNNVITAYDTNTFLKIGSITLPSFNAMPTSLVRWGTNGLAFRVPNSSSNVNDSRIYILQSALVSGTGTIPTGVQFSATAASMYENSTGITVNVTRSGDVSGTSTVTYKTVDGSAVAGVDYVAAAGTLTFAPGEYTKTILVQPINDTVFEPTETFSVLLERFPEGDTVITAPSSISILITDDDTRPFISGANTAVDEGRAGTSTIASVPVTLNHASTETVTVNYATSDLTAIAGLDYASTTGTLTFAPLEVKKTIPVTIFGDNAIEGSESFRVTLSSATNGSSSTTPMTVTINDYVTPNVLRAAADFDGDGRTDVSVFRPAEGVWYLQRSTAGFAGYKFGLPNDVVTPGDFTGDRKTDIAVWRPAEGMWYIMRSDDATFYSVQLGSEGDIPAPADYDGDGKSDAAVYRPGNGTWYLQRSNAGSAAIQFGIAEDKPTVGDFDGDGKADVAVFRPSTGTWYRLNSSDGTYAAAQFGQTGDKVVPADYSGDGKTDLAVWRPTDRTWYIMRSDDNSFCGVQFGITDDLPVPGDYDGDGKADVAVFRPATGTWFEQRSTTGFAAVQFGATGDKPAPNAFVY